jgi:hypothetical protein
MARSLTEGCTIRQAGDTVNGGACVKEGAWQG